ncbi:MAG TPA: D-2-hydroxyacid dehydrogenase [Verrucomicrobiae bacterium]|jgi:phosphoglycerate dehydrogenase-like enzyme|nr:D-2-hydroxyacid dehydrogenase [Verrucomicrobiae bacterium]
MKMLKIFSDAPLTDSALKLLKTGVGTNELIFPSKPGNSVLAKSEADPTFAEAEVAFGQPDLLNIAGSSRLRWMHLTSAGYTRYDTPEFRSLAKTRGLIATNSSTVYAQPCAEHVLAFMLAQARRLPSALGSNCASGSPEWVDFRGTSTLLLRQKVVLLGFGAIAVKLAEMLRPFEMDLVALRRQARGDETVRIISEAELPQALADADHVVNILPANKDSAHFISAERLAAMKPGAILYNIGRGATVDQSALANSLHSGHLGAAWLDVTEPEPLPPGHPLLSAPNCFITPHIGGGQRAEAEALVSHFLANLYRYCNGAPLMDRIM